MDEEIRAIQDPQPDEKHLTAVEEMDLKARFLEVYASRNDGTSIESVCKKINIPNKVAAQWFDDRAFKSQIQHINERRIERVLEIFAENSVAIAKKTVETALSNGKYQQRAAALIFEALGVKKTRESLVTIQENNLVIRTQEDLDKAKQRSAELDDILNSVKIGNKKS